MDYVMKGLLDPFSQVSFFILVPQFEGFMLSGGSA
jgi:hypothetical protein